jgi:hypothetical protein
LTFAKTIGTGTSNDFNLLLHVHVDGQPQRVVGRINSVQFSVINVCLTTNESAALLHKLHSSLLDSERSLKHYSISNCD